MGIRVRLIFVCLTILICYAQAFAGSIVASQPISFGNIVADPRGEVIEIDATAGPALPRVYSSGNSIVSGGGSGLIRVATDTPGELITLIFPTTVPVAGGGATHYVNNLTVKSTYTPVVGSGVGTIDFNLGGILHIKSGQPDNTYNFDILVTVQFDNP